MARGEIERYEEEVMRGDKRKPSYDTAFSFCSNRRWVKGRAGAKEFREIT